MSEFTVLIKDTGKKSRDDILLQARFYCKQTVNTEAEDQADR